MRACRGSFGDGKCRKWPRTLSKMSLAHRRNPSLVDLEPARRARDVRTRKERGKVIIVDEPGPMKLRRARRVSWRVVVAGGIGAISEAS